MCIVKAPLSHSILVGQFLEKCGHGRNYSSRVTLQRNTSVFCEIYRVTWTERVSQLVIKQSKYRLRKIWLAVINPTIFSFATTRSRSIDSNQASSRHFLPSCRYKHHGRFHPSRSLLCAAAPITALKSKDTTGDKYRLIQAVEGSAKAQVDGTTFPATGLPACRNARRVDRLSQCFRLLRLRTAAQKCHKEPGKTTELAAILRHKDLGNC